MPLTPKPDWFETTFTEWGHPSKIPCAKTPGFHAATVLHAAWIESADSARRNEYRLATNQGRKHWILWEGETDEGKLFFTPVAYGPCRGPNGDEIEALDAAAHLLIAAWAGEDKYMSGTIPPTEARGLLAGQELDAICSEVWPETPAST